MPLSVVAPLVLEPLFEIVVAVVSLYLLVLSYCARGDARVRGSARRRAVLEAGVGVGVGIGVGACVTESEPESEMAP